MDLVKPIFPTYSENEYIQYLKKEEYESYYSTKNKYPYIVIERLSMNTGNPAEGYEKVKRQNVEDPFKPDPEIKPEASFTNKDYALMMSYGLSPGHNAPAGHHHTRPDIWESTFLYSNICPQEMTFNSGIWVILENWCKFISKKQKQHNFTNLRIITGSIPDKKVTTLKFGNNILNINIPTHMFKIVTARSKSPEHNNKLFIGCFLYPNRPLDPMKPENRELANWLVPLPKLQELCGFQFEHIFKKYYGYESGKYELLNIHDLVPVSFTLNKIFELQMLKSQWYGIIIYSKDLETLEQNWKLLQEHPILGKEDLQYHKEFYLLAKDKFNSFSANTNNNVTPTEISMSSFNNTENSVNSENSTNSANSVNSENTSTMNKTLKGGKLNNKNKKKKNTKYPKTKKKKIN